MKRSSIRQSLGAAYTASLNQELPTIAAAELPKELSCRKPKPGPAMPGNRIVQRSLHFCSGACGLSHISRHDSVRHRLRDRGSSCRKAIDTGANSPVFGSIIVNLTLMSLFAVQHSVMARRRSSSGGRSLFRSRSSAAPMCCAQAWRFASVLAMASDPDGGLAGPEPNRMALPALSLVGWVIVFTSTFLINHFELFGLQQVAHIWSRAEMPAPCSGRQSSTGSCGIRSISASSSRSGRRR